MTETTRSGTTGLEIGALGTRCRGLLEYWETIREPGEQVADRDRFDPTAIPKLLANIHLMEWRSPCDIRYRLSGTEEVLRLGGDPKGRNYMDAVDPEAQAYLRAYFFQIMEHPAAIYIATEESYSSGVMRQTRFIGLPLLRRRTGERFTICVVDADERVSMPNAVSFAPAVTLWWDRIVAVDLFDLGHGLPDVPCYRATSE